MSYQTEFLESYHLDRPSTEYVAVYNALVMCLTPEEACHALDLAFLQDYRKRRAIVRKIQSDMHAETLPCHQTLINNLEQVITTLPGRGKASGAGTLLLLAEKLSPEKEQSIVERLSTSHNGNIRKQVYRRVKQLHETDLPEYVIAAWKMFRDFEAARLIIIRASDTVLAEYFQQLEEDVIPQGYLLAKLYLRLQEHTPTILDRLAAIDPVSYIYVCTKLNVGVSDTLLVSVFHEARFTERAGLVIWCCGQMRRWGALQQILQILSAPLDNTFGTLTRDDTEDRAQME